MNNSFISLVGLIEPDRDLVQKYLKNMQTVLKDNFSDYEIILVNNICPADFEPWLQELDEEIRRAITVINLSQRVPDDNAFVAGLDRANGDFTVILDMQFAEEPELILEMYNKTQENNDVVYLRYKKRRLPLFRKVFYKLFYYLMNRNSEIKIDPKMHTNRIISRRALNSIVRVREQLRYMKGIYAYVGYKSAWIERDIKESQSKSRKHFKSAVVALTSFTDIVSSMLKWVFIFTLLFSIGVSANALTVKLAGVDLLGNAQTAVPGWTSQILYMSFMFSILFFMLYLMSLYLVSINSEIKQRPVYIVESFKRF